MEGMIGWSQEIEESHHCIEEQLNALAVVDEVFTQESESLYRQEEVKRLDALLEMLDRKVQYFQMSESASASEFSQQAVNWSIGNFVFGTMASAFFNTGEHPVTTGLRLAQGELSKTAPFHSILVTIGTGGVPEDVDVINLSSRARENRKSESQIRTSLEDNGCLLMESLAFSKALGKLRQNVLNGIVTLPVAALDFV